MDNATGWTGSTEAEALQKFRQAEGQHEADRQQRRITAIVFSVFVLFLVALSEIIKQGWR